jgi:ATPase subunit of ABC transporter with duplicated ATPase domains
MRIELAKLLLQATDVLLLDEPNKSLRYRKYHLVGKFFYVIILV